MSILHNDANTGHSAVAAIVGWWHDLKLAAAFRSDFADCSPGEIERMARDIGLTSQELQRLVGRGREAAELLFDRMAALNLNPADVEEVERATFLDLERACTFCDCKGRCKRDLALQPDDAVWEDYCPNVATLKMLNALPWASRRVG